MAGFLSGRDAFILLQAVLSPASSPYFANMVKKDAANDSLPGTVL